MSASGAGERCGAEYERLRGQALRGGAPPEMGLALLERQGLAVWLDAWMSVPAPCGAAPEPAPSALPTAVRQELVLALASLVLGRRVEVQHG